MSSNSGAKAPLVLLKDEFQMLPGAGRDYDFVITGRHSTSIHGVADGKYAAAAVANDLPDRNSLRYAARGEIGSANAGWPHWKEVSNALPDGLSREALPDTSTRKSSGDNSMAGKGE
jgi:hypothetical protein